MNQIIGASPVSNPTTAKNIVQVGYAGYGTGKSATAASASLHKSFDFSNVALTTNSKTSEYRKFHQTTLYIQKFSNMLHHGKVESSSQSFLLSANLPESVQYRIGSTWGNPLSFGNDKFNLLMQMGGSSGVNRVASLKVWNGTDPFSIRLRIPVIDDTKTTDATSKINTNLAEGLEFLGSLCLPQTGNGLGFYTPPPSPLNVVTKAGVSAGSTTIAATGNWGPTYARMMLQLGGILLVDHCLVESVDVEYPNTKALIRHSYTSGVGSSGGGSYLAPLLAYLTITISTVEALTANNFSKMLWLQQQEGVGNVTIGGVANLWNSGGSTENIPSSQ